MARSHSERRHAAFYQAVGFLPIEEFPDLWGAENPCLLHAAPVVEPAVKRLVALRHSA